MLGITGPSSCGGIAPVNACLVGLSDGGSYAVMVESL